MASRRRGSVGLDGAESQCCDLSGRGLTSGQIERTLRVFATADTIDLSNNEIDKVPSTLPVEVVTLDISFNLISSVSGIERLKYVQELHLAFNRLDDVSLLEFCPRLLRVNLSGNRLMNTRGLETLEFLENLDLSDNLLEFSEALRPLSLNQNLTHLTIRGNPLSQKPGYHVPLLDMIPSVIILDDKKIRSASKYKSKEVSATKSLSYSRIYDDKKQFVIRKQTRPRPATTVRPILPGDSPSKYDSTMFLQPPIEPTYERTRANLQTFQQLPADTAPFSPLASPSRVQSPAKSRAAPYMSLYDRLAKSNGIPANKSCAPPSKPIFDPNRAANTPNSATAMKLPNGGQPASTRSGRTMRKPSSETPRGRGPAEGSIDTHRVGTGRDQTPVRSVTPHHDTWQELQQQQQWPSANGPPPAPMTRPATPHTASALDDKQRNVLTVIQNLIQHKRQTLSTLGAQKAGSPPSATPTRTRAHNFAGQLVS